MTMLVKILDGGAAHYMGEGFWMLTQPDASEGVQSVGVSESELRALVANDYAGEVIAIEEGEACWIDRDAIQLHQIDEYGNGHIIVVTERDVRAMLSALPLAA